MEQVFIIVCAVGVVWAYFTIPETKGIPLEELAKIFGDDDEIVVYMKDIVLDHDTHKLTVNIHQGEDDLIRVATELHKPNGGDHIEKIPTKSKSGGTSGTESV